MIKIIVVILGIIMVIVLMLLAGCKSETSTSSAGLIAKSKNNNEVLNDKILEQEIEINKVSYDEINIGDIYCGVLGICVEIKPTKKTIAGKKYTMELYEFNKLRDSQVVSFNQPQINVESKTLVSYYATLQEKDAYMMEDISNIFSAKVK